MEINTEIFKEIGLTEGETKTYLALLKLGETTTGPLINESKVAKSIVYQILEKLIKKGLVSYSIKDKTKHFTAEHPNKIFEYIEKRKLEFEKQKKKLKDYLPELMKYQKKTNDTQIRIYEGFEGVQTAFNHYQTKLEKGDEYLGFGIFGSQDQKYHNFWMQHHLKRIDQGINSRLLFNTNTPPVVLENRNSYKGCDSRYQHNKLKTPAWIQIYKDVSTIFLQSKDLAVEITNQEIADTFKVLFEDYWEKTKPFKIK
jgi:predicted transcriptional regulator